MIWDIIFRNSTASSLIFCIAFSLISILWQANPFAGGVSALGRLSDRLSGALNSGLQLPSILFVELDRYRELEQRYNQAQRALEEHRLERNQLEHLQRENDSLRRELGFPSLSEFDEVRAPVLGIRINSISPRLIIGLGSNDGLTPFMPVVTHAHDRNNNLIRAVVGVIATTDSTTAVVQPLMHPGFQLGVRIVESGQWAILSGNSSNKTQVLLNYIANDARPETIAHQQMDQPVEPGFTVISSGAGGIFPAGIPVGVVRGAGPLGDEFQTAWVEPFAPITNMEYVTVIRKSPEAWAGLWEKDDSWVEHLTTEFGPPYFDDKPITAETRQQPPAPTPAPTVTPAPTAPATPPEATTPAEPQGERERRRLQNPATFGEGM